MKEKKPILRMWEVEEEVKVFLKINFPHRFYLLYPEEGKQKKTSKPNHNILSFNGGKGNE